MQSKGIESSNCEPWANFQKKMQEQGYDSCQSVAALVGQIVAGTSLFVVGCIALSGGFSSASTIGWVTVGLGAGFILFKFGEGGDFKKKKFDLIVLSLEAITFIALGALAATGSLSLYSLGVGIVVTPFAGMCFTCYCSSLDSEKRKQFAKGYEEAQKQNI